MMRDLIEKVKGDNKYQSKQDRCHDYFLRFSLQQALIKRIAEAFDQYSTDNCRLFSTCKSVYILFEGLPGKG